MQVRLPILMTHIPELAALPEPRRQEVLDRCANDPSMQVLRKRCTMLVRLGWAVLPVGLIAYLVLTRTAINPKIIFWFLVVAMVTSVTVMVGSLLLYCRR